jgi:hypothetical protein
MGSAYSNTVAVTVGAPETAVILACTPENTTRGNDLISQNVLAWNAIGSYTYQVFRQINNGGYDQISSLTGSISGYLDFDLADAFQQGQYDYYVLVLSGSTIVATSNIASVTWPRGDENPLELEVAQSSYFQASTFYHLNTLTWNDIDAATYTVFRKINQGLPVSITQVGGAVLTYADEGIADSPSFPAGTYEYYVLAADYNNAPIATSPTESVTWT